MNEEETFMFSPKIDTAIKFVGDWVIILGFVYLIAKIIEWAGRAL